MNILGITPGMIICGNASSLDLTGNWTGGGTFEISNTSSTSGFISEAFGLDNTSPGSATYTPAGALLPPGSAQKPYYIRYLYLGPGCNVAAKTTEQVIVNPQPALAFSGSIPAANTAYCFEQSSSPTTINLSTVPSTNVTMSGYGVTDNGGGLAIFNPTSAYQQSSLANNLNPFTDDSVRSIQVIATRTDAVNCSNKATVNYTVNPLPPGTFAPAKTSFCYEDATATLQGGQVNVSYLITYKNTSPNYSLPKIFTTTTNFDPQFLFDSAVALGANSLATLQFDVVYTSINSATTCSNELAPVTFNISPSIPVEISGIDDNQIFCANATDKELGFNPPDGKFYIDNVEKPFTNAKYLFDPVISGPAGGTNYSFKYEVITGNNCTNTKTKVVRVLPSPRALFSVTAKCDTALIAYNAQSSTNLASAVYTWTLSDVIKTGQNVDHRFPGVSTYSVQLKVKHPPFVVDANTTLVCADSLRLDQIIGPYPAVDFNFFNVCEEDNTDFEVVTPKIPISKVSWDFGDGEATALGVLSNPVPGLSNTTGLFQAPVHTYGASADSIPVKVVGRTSDEFGGCETTFSRAISILKRWAPSPAEPSYDMTTVDPSGKGFWVVEDKNGNSSWDFQPPAKTKISTPEPAWVTGPVTPYNASDASYVNSPCFDLSSFTRPVLSLKHWSDTEPSDGAVLQYSIDGGKNWERLGNVASGLEWYNKLTISANPGEQSEGWSAENQLDWTVGKHTLDVVPLVPGNRSKVRFRVAFSSFNNLQQRDGFAFNNFVIEERNRTILVENFTNLEETNNNNAFKNFHTVGGIFNTQELVKLQYHHAFLEPQGDGPDELNQDNPTDQNARAAFYGVTVPVRAFVDGGFGQAATNFTFLSGTTTTLNPQLDTYFSLRSLVTAPVDVSIDFDPLPASRLNVKATITTHSTIAAGQYNVFIAIAEQSVLQQAYVLRKFLPDAAGIPLTALLADAEQTIDLSYDMRHVTRLTDGSFAPIAVIVFIQNLETKDVLQTAMRQDVTPPSTIITGVETPLENYIRLYPNPADRAINIMLPTPVNVETPVKLFDTFGKQVFDGAFSVGQHLKTIETKNLSGGVYLIQVETAEGMVRKKAMVVHE
jgi:hypothetical protein